MCKLFVKSQNHDQAFQLSDGQYGYMFVHQSGNRYRYAFTFQAHEHHSFWVEGPHLLNGQTILVHSIDGDERFRIILR